MCKCNKCPKCGEEFQKPIRCICGDTMWISIPPGEHIHIDCPVHGDVKIYGPSYYYSKERNLPQWNITCLNIGSKYDRVMF